MDTCRLSARRAGSVLSTHGRPQGRASMPRVAVIVAAHDEEAGDRAADREPARARLSSRAARDRRHLGRVDRRHRGARRSRRRARDPQSTRRQGRRAGPRGARDDGGDRRVLGRELRPGRPTHFARLVRTSPIPTSPTSAGVSTSRRDDGRNKEGVYWRYELALRADESRIDSVTGGNGSIYAVRRERLRRGRSALRPRSLVSVSHGAARAPRGVRA